ncbi:MAG: enoyl-CoA hydratase/isomerase family protein [Candidatus Acidiferrales bacterium]
MDDSSLTSLIEHRREDGIALLQLANPAGYPRLDLATVKALRDQIAILRSLSEIRGIVITGTEKAFAVGAEISELMSLSAIEARMFSELGQSVMRSIERFPRPVVAAIRGYCLGGGLDLALACHARIATEDVVFAHPGGSLGILTGWGGTVRLPRLIGRARAMELFVTGRNVEAQEALSISLIEKIASFDKAIETADAWAKNLA